MMLYQGHVIGEPSLCRPILETYTMLRDVTQAYKLFLSMAQSGNFPPLDVMVDLSLQLYSEVHLQLGDELFEKLLEWFGPLVFDHNYGQHAHDKPNADASHGPSTVEEVDVNCKYLVERGKYLLAHGKRKTFIRQMVECERLVGSRAVLQHCYNSAMKIVPTKVRQYHMIFFPCKC